MNTMAAVPANDHAGSTQNLGWAWVFLALALAVHVTDEATTGFLAIYNPTVETLRARLGYWPMPTFEFREWLTGLIALAGCPLAAVSVRLSRGALDPAGVLCPGRDYVL